MQQSEVQVLQIQIIERQAPGTWLPLVVERDGVRMDVTAKFPVRFE